MGRIVNQNEDVEDLCQDIFIKVFRKLRSFKGESRLSTWIAAIAYNTSISHLKARSRKPEISFSGEDLLHYDWNDGGRMGDVFEKKELKEIVLQLVEKLPVHYRTVLTLFHLEEFSYKEVGEITGMPEGTIKSYLARARAILRKHLERIMENEKVNIFTDDAGK